MVFRAGKPYSTRRSEVEDIDEFALTEEQEQAQIDRNIGYIAKHFGISPGEVLDGDYHYFMHQIHLIAEEHEEEEEPITTKPIKREESLFAAFGVNDIE